LRVPNGYGRAPSPAALRAGSPLVAPVVVASKIASRLVVAYVEAGRTHRYQDL